MKQFLIMAMAAAVAVGCSKQDSMDTVQEPGVVRVFMGVEAPASKATVTPATGATGVRFLKADAATAPTTFAAVSASGLLGNVAATTGAVTFTAGEFSYNNDDTKAWMVAYHPAGTLATNKVTWPINGSSDIMRTDVVWAAGQYSAPLTGATGTKMILNHCLSRVEVVCKAEVASALATVRSAWGNIKKIEFLGAPTTMVYDLATLAVTNGTAVADFALLKDYTGAAFASLAIPTSSSSVVNAVAMLAPVAVANSASFKLKITTEGPLVATSDDITQTVDVKLTNSAAPTAMLKANTHVVTLTFKADNKEIDIASSTIEAWATGSTAGLEIEKPL